MTETPTDKKLSIEPKPTAARDLGIDVLSNCALRYVNGNSQAEIDRAINLAETIIAAAIRARGEEKGNG